MAWGFWKKVKNAFKKAGQWIKNKIVMPVVNFAKKVFTSEPVKKVVGGVLNLAPVVGAAIAGPAGAQVGMAAQGIGRAIGLGGQQ